MVFAASGAPLYLPPRARKKLGTSLATNGAGVMQDHDGMQSLLSAIELDLNHARNVIDQIADQSFDSSLVNSPNNHELVADLLDTNFEDARQLGDTDEQITSLSSSGLLTDDVEDVMSMTGMDLLEFDTLNGDSNLLDQAPQRRTWLGLPEDWKDSNIREARIKSVIRTHLPAIMQPIAKLDTKDNRLTTIRFTWPAVAQKSYGNERRLFTPFPTCSIEGAYSKLCGSPARAHLEILPYMTTIKPAPQSVDFDFEGRARFRSLHVSNQTVGKAKSIKFRLQISQNGSREAHDIPLLDLSTPDIIVQSKPSKRVSRMKVQSSYIYTNTSVSLFSRVNSQTARTRYLTLENAKLSALGDSWTPFMIHEFKNGNMQTNGTIRPLLLGDVVVLKDPQSDFVSVPLIVRRSKGKVLSDDVGNNVSQMQKVVFERCEAAMSKERQEDNARCFLTSRQAHTPRDQQSKNESVTCYTTFETASTRSRDIRNLEIDDAAQWTIAGISQFNCAFIDALSVDSDERKSNKHEKACQISADVAETDSNLQSRKRKRESLDGPNVHANGTDSTTIAKMDSPALPSKDFDFERALAEVAADDLKKAQENASRAASILSIQTPLSPLPTLGAVPRYFNGARRLFLQIKDYWQKSSCLKNSDVYLGPFGPLQIHRIIQSPILFTDASLEVSLPTRAETEDMDRLPLLFVREDGIIVLAQCIITIPA